MRKIASPVELAQELLRLEAYTRTEFPERKRIATVLRELADRCDPVRPRNVKASMSESEFWTLIEPFGWGTRSTDYKAIKKALMAKLSPEEANEMQATFSMLRRNLVAAIKRYEEETESELDVLGDSLSDLLAHIIGMGKREYEANLRNPALVFEREEKGAYRESFTYALPWKTDYENLKVGKYVEWAKSNVSDYKMVLGADEEDIPWLPKLRPFLRTLISALEDFIRTQNVHALLSQEEVLKKAAEAVGHILGRLNVSSYYEEGSMAEAISSASNKWGMWNLLSDLRDYLT